MVWPRCGGECQEGNLLANFPWALGWPHLLHLAPPVAPIARVASPQTTHPSPGATPPHLAALVVRKLPLPRSGRASAKKARGEVCESIPFVPPPHHSLYWTWSWAATIGFCSHKPVTPLHALKPRPQPPPLSGELNGMSEKGILSHSFTPFWFGHLLSCL